MTDSKAEPVTKPLSLPAEGAAVAEELDSVVDCAAGAAEVVSLVVDAGATSAACEVEAAAVEGVSLAVALEEAGAVLADGVPDAGVVAGSVAFGALGW